MGLKLQGEKGFSVEPCIPKEWQGYSIDYSRAQCKYHITVNRGDVQCNQTKINGIEIQDNLVPLAEKGEFNVEIVIPR